MIWYSDDADELAFRTRLLERIKKDAGIGDLLPEKRISYFWRYRWVAAAGIFLLIFGGLSYLLSFRKEISSAGMPHRVAIQDIPPGHNGAILTLANGNKIVLDSADNGKIAVQGDHCIIKKKGQLAYEKVIEKTPSKDAVNADKKVIYNTIATPRGRQFSIVLSDGSKVWLNAASSITYPTAFTGKERKVSITGEIYFEIARDSRHPFMVAAGAAEITVLGTHFDVMAYPDEKLLKTTLLEGSVKVSHGDQQVIITSGQQASFSPQADHINVTTVNTGQAVAWVEGKLSLNDLGIAAIMRRVSRWYNVDVEFEGPVPQGHYWGMINRDVSLSDILSVMRASGIEANLKGNKVIVSSDH
jgi:hypothetical protein